MKKTRILVACGAGIATSTVVVDKIEKLLKKHDLLSEIIQCKISEVVGRQNDADLIVSTTMLPTTYSIPALKATAFITGIGMDKLEAEILRLIRG